MSAKFQARIFVGASKNWARIISWTSFLLCIILLILLVSDITHYELTELTEYTTYSVSVVIYFGHMIGFWMAFMALIWTNETTSKRHYIPYLVALVGSHVIVFMARVLCELTYVEYRPELYRDIDEDDFLSSYCPQVLIEQNLVNAAGAQSNL